MITKIVIVGGGTAGWMTAAYLKHAMGERIDITLVESASINTIGVGEATFSTIKLFFDFLGLRESDWMPHCNAAYKLAIKFVGWTAEGRPFYHPFQRYPVVDGFNLGEWWLAHKRDTIPWDHACFTVPALCESKRSPRYLDGTVYDANVQSLFTEEHIRKKNVLQNHHVQFPYAYHFDASLLARFLTQWATQRGVAQVFDEVVEVRQREDGTIDHIQTREHGAIAGDLFIDCTGFRGLLINKVLGERFIHFNESLLCDSAVAMQVPVDIQTKGIEPFTTATALGSGWVWNIPLYGRIGTGYVYCSDFISSEQAEADLRAHLGPASENCKPNHIKMRIGRNENSWQKNCIAIGLSSGFVEPLESTGIFFIQHGIEELLNHFPQSRNAPELAQSYNRNVGACIDGVRDFLTLHYFASDRADTPFWKATKRVMVPDSVRERLELWKTRLPNARSINPNYHGFEFYSYSVMMLGLNYRPASSLPVLEHVDPQNAERAFEEIQRRSAHLIATLPSQYEYLKHVRSEQIPT